MQSQLAAPFGLACASNALIMKDLVGKTALLTGASGGLGKYIAHNLADAGMNLCLVAFPGNGLEKLRAAIEQKGRKAIAIPADLRLPDRRPYVVQQTLEKFGAIDVLVNNAGIEYTSDYHELTLEQIQDVLSVNLEAPMVLTRLVLPDMVKRGSGHIVNMSSLAGKASPACQEPYAASKAGLIGFTASLRATYRGTGVSASVICPGFVEAGIYERLKSNTGFTAPLLLGTVPPEPIGKAVVRSIRKDLPEVIINKWPVRPLVATIALSPALGAWMIWKIGGHGFFKKIYHSQRAKITAPAEKQSLAQAAAR